jgi:uncharacterized protein YecT (DUF1311 family)
MKFGYLKHRSTDRKNSKKDQSIDMNISLPKIECLARHYDNYDIELTDSFENSVSSKNSKERTNNKVRVIKR